MRGTEESPPKPISFSLPFQRKMKAHRLAQPEFYDEVKAVAVSMAPLVLLSVATVRAERRLV